MRASLDAACAVLGAAERAAFSRLRSGRFRAAAIGTWEQAEALVDAGLIDADRDGYRAHDLVALYARAQVSSVRRTVRIA